jgi:putative phage-type endonuclease
MSAPEAGSPEWHAERQTGIGGSDAAAVVGINPYKTPYEAYLEKTGELAPLDLSDNDAVHFGNVLEAVVCDEFAAREGKQVRRSNAMLRSKEHPFIVCHLDRRVVGERAIVEAKTAGAHRALEFGEPWTDQLPEEYLVQSQHNMYVAEADRAYVPVLIGGQKYGTYVVERDDVLIARLVKIEVSFWDLVLRKEPPGIKSMEDARARYKLSADVTVVASTDIEQTVAELAAAKALAKGYEEQIDALAARIMAFMGEADTLTDLRGNKLATWKTIRQIDETRAASEKQNEYLASLKSKLDTAAFKKAIGAKTYDGLLVPSPTRRFALTKES